MELQTGMSKEGAVQVSKRIKNRRPACSFLGSGNAFGEMIFELRPGVQGRVENFESRDPTGTGGSFPTWPLLLADSDVVPWCGFRHLLCAELLHLGKALIRSGKCPPQ